MYTTQCRENNVHNLYNLHHSSSSSRLSTITHRHTCTNMSIAFISSILRQFCVSVTVSHTHTHTHWGRVHTETWRQRSNDHIVCVCLSVCNAASDLDFWLQTCSVSYAIDVDNFSKFQHCTISRDRQMDRQTEGTTWHTKTGLIYTVHRDYCSTTTNVFYFPFS